MTSQFIPVEEIPVITKKLLKAGLYQTLKEEHFEVAKRLFTEALEKQKIVVYGDPDVDGIVACASVIHFIRNEYGFEPAVAINDNRAHGVLQTKMLLDFRTPIEMQVEIPKDYLIFNVDSSISEERLEELVHQGYSVVSLDHHEIEAKDKNKCIHKKEGKAEGIVLNNQYDFEDKQYQFQSGAGVVLSFLHQFQPDYIERHPEWIALNGITLLSDAREIEGPIARQFLRFLYKFKPYNNPYSKLIKHLVDTIGFNQYSIGEYTLDRVYIDFQFSPFINALMRFNKGYETIKWFNFESLEFKDPAGMQKEVIKELLERKRILRLNHLVIVTLECLVTDWFDASNFIGLVANKLLLVEGKTIVIAAFKKGVFYRGSVRGLHNSVAYNTAFNKMGMDARGHQGAFGLKTMNLDVDFWKEADKYIGLLDERHTEQYDIIRSFNLSKDYNKIKEVAEENQYRRFQNKIYVQYVGMHISEIQLRSNKIREFEIDSLVTRAFDVTIQPRQPGVFIEPTLDRGFLKLYLVKLNVK